MNCRVQSGRAKSSVRPHINFSRTRLFIATLEAHYPTFELISLWSFSLTSAVLDAAMSSPSERFIRWAVAEIRVNVEQQT